MHSKQQKKKRKKVPAGCWDKLTTACGLCAAAAVLSRKYLECKVATDAIISMDSMRFYWHYNTRNAQCHIKQIATDT